MDIVEFARDVLDIKLFPYQERLLRKMEKGESVIIMSRKPGRKTLERICDEFKQRQKLRPNIR